MTLGSRRRPTKSYDVAHRDASEGIVGKVKTPTNIVPLADRLLADHLDAEIDEILNIKALHPGEPDNAIVDAAMIARFILAHSRASRTSVALAPWVLGCSGVVDYRSSSHFGVGGAGGGSEFDQSGETTFMSAGASAVDGGFREYVDPRCLDAGPPVEVDQCDAFSAASGCPTGQGCYPFVMHPQGAGCGTPISGTQCSRAGPGHQGAPCNAGVSECASGFACVVGAEPGKHCAHLCRIGDKSSCALGLICGDLDIEGFGA